MAQELRSSQSREGRTDDLSGYDVDFVQPLDRKYVCPICLAALRNPMQTACGHRFCKRCIMGCVVNGRPLVRCPVDNVLFGVKSEMFLDNAFRREILSLNVRCGNAAVGCTWIGELRALECHALLCQFVSTECTNKCGTSVLRRDMTDHLDVCELRPAVCSHCQISLPYADMTKHQVLMCQNFPVQCTSCGKSGIRRKEISNHIDAITGNCPSTIIACQYASFGCQFQSIRRLMDDHHKDATSDHLLLLIRRVWDQEQRIRTLESEIHMVQRALSSGNDIETNLPIADNQ